VWLRHPVKTGSNSATNLSQSLRIDFNSGTASIEYFLHSQGSWDAVIVAAWRAVCSLTPTQRTL
jgi:hypothetical protein